MEAADVIICLFPLEQHFLKELTSFKKEYKVSDVLVPAVIL